MPYARATLTELNSLALQDIQTANLAGVDGLLQKAVLRVLARVEAGLSNEHYGYQDRIARDSVPWTAQGEALTGWAALKTVQQKAATTSTLTAAFTGSVGTDLPAETAMTTPDGLGFSSIADASVAAGGIVSVSIVSSGTGTAYNLAVGAQITLSSVITGINSTGQVTSVVTAAADQESTDDFRTRMLQVYASPPQGGAASDYVTWAEAVPGVTRAWCNPNGAGAGTVVVYVMFDDVEAASGGFPQGTNGVAAAETRAGAATGDQLTVANAIYPLQPVTALVYVCAPAGSPIAFTIADLYPATPLIKAGITAALQDLFLRIGTPEGMTVYPSDWNGAINSVPGIEHFAVTSPSAPVTLGIGFLPELGTLNTSA